MKRFVWRPQRVLDLKVKEEQVKKIELIRLTKKLTDKRSELLMRKRILSDMLADLARMEPQARLRQQELFLRHSNTSNMAIKGLEEQIRVLVSQQQELIAELVKMRRFREGLEKLRAQAEAEFMQQQEKQEAKAADEMATIRFACRNRAEVGVN